MSESSNAASVGSSLGQGPQFRKASKWQGFLAGLQELSWALQEVVLGSLQRLMRSPPGVAPSSHLLGVALLRNRRASQEGHQVAGLPSQPAGPELGPARSCAGQPAAFQSLLTR